MGRELDYLESERKKLWAKIVQLEEQIVKPPAEYEAEAKQSSKKATEFKNKTEESKNQASTNAESIKSILEEAQDELTEFKRLHSDISILAEGSIGQSDLIRQKHEELLLRQEKIETQITEIERIFEGQTNISEKLSKLNVIFDAGNDYASKLEAVYKSLLVRKADIDNLHLDIIGYVDIDKDTGATTTIEGKKAELENSF
jgi:chromosome segregation ATPase